MPVYVDQIRHYPGSGPWCHMGTDNVDDLTELHALAKQIGLRRAWFQDHPRHPHYDLRPGSRAAAIRAGAIPVGNRKFVQLCSLYGRDSVKSSSNGA